MKNNKGFSLTEVLISLVVGSVLILSIGALSSVSMSGYSKARKEADVYHEIVYSLKMIQNRVHATTQIIAQPLPQTSPWVSNRLVLGNEAFGLYDNTVNVPASWDLIHLPDQSNINNREVMFSVPKSNNSLPTLNFTVTGSLITVALSGQKDDISFNLSSTIVRRSQ